MNPTRQPAPKRQGPSRATPLADARNGRQPLLVAAIVVMSVAAGCNSADDEPAADATAVAQSISTAVVDTGGVAATLARPLSGALRELRAGPLADLRERVQTAMATLVTAADGMTFSWAAPTATVRFVNCRIPETNLLLNGAMGVRIRLVDPAAVITLDHLTVGATELDGTMIVTPIGPLAALTLGVDADVTVTRNATSLVFSALVVEASAEGVTVSGNGQVISPKLDADATMRELNWKLGDCLPSSGSVSFVDGNLTGVVTFLPTTPATGEVRLRIPPLPATTVPMFPACE